MGAWMLLLAIGAGDHDEARSALLQALERGPMQDAGAPTAPPEDGTTGAGSAVGDRRPPVADAGAPPSMGPSLDAGPRGGGSGASYGLRVELLGDGAQPGDTVTLAIRLRYPKAMAIELPQHLPDGKGLAPVGPPQRRPEEDGDFIIETLRFPFVLLAIAGVESPEFSIAVGDEELAVPALPLRVADAGPSAAPPDPEPAPMVVYRPGPAPWVLPTLAALVLGLIALVGLKRWLANRPEAEAPAPPPIDHAAVFLTLLLRLRGELSDDPDQLKAAWFALLAGLRDYLDARFGLHSAQSTTEEMMAALAAARLVGFPRVGLRALLEQADAVRYAGAESSREAMADLLDQVEVWVRTAEAGAAS